MKLSELKIGETAKIVSVQGHGGFRRRIVEMGFVRGHTVRVVQTSPLRDPIEYEILGYKISLRRAEAALVEVSVDAVQEEAPLTPMPRNMEECARGEECAECHAAAAHREKGKDSVIRVALVGNPNCGKTSLFNIASGAHEHVGNYSGVTVDAIEGEFSLEIPIAGEEKHACKGSCCTGCPACFPQTRTYTFRIVDLPGTYSLSAYSPEEKFVRRALEEERPDVVINVVDAGNLARNLYLTTQLMDMNLRTVVALNMYDELERRGDVLDVSCLSHLLGLPIVPTIGRTGQGIRELFSAVVELFETTEHIALHRHVHVAHGQALEESILRLRAIFRENAEAAARFSPRWLAIKFLEGDKSVEAFVETLPEHDALISARFAERARIEAELGTNAEQALVDAKYGFIAGALRESLVQKNEGTRLKADTPSDSGRTAQPLRPSALSLKSDRIDSVVCHRLWGFPIFLALLFLIFEATFALGQYPMEWIEWVVEKLGEFLALQMPDSWLKDLVIDGALAGVGSVIVFLPNILILYFFLSALEDTGYMARAAFIMDRIMHRMGLHGKSFIPMVMGFGCNVPAIMATRTIENPRSRLTTMLVVPFMSCSARIPIYITLIGAFFPEHGALLLLGLYALGLGVGMISARLLSRALRRGDDLPFVMELPPYRVPSFRAVRRHTWEKGRQYLRKMGGIILIFSVLIWALDYIQVGDESLLAHAGHALAPLFAPMGFDWRMTVGILSGIGAKELMVSTLSVMVPGGDYASLMTPSSAAAYMVFALLYFPCFATLAAIRAESGGWKYALFAAGYTTAVAYALSVVAYWIF